MKKKVEQITNIREMRTNGRKTQSGGTSKREEPKKKTHTQATALETTQIPGEYYTAY